ncbi:MAG: hypothetical protein IJ226_04260 [Clostridia bacterium]|nr:hypothetical protein [Clostridia bacterium]
MAEPSEAEKAEDKPQESPAEKAEEKPAEAQEEPKKARKPRQPKEPKDEWGLSPTTLNQKYSKPSGKNKNITAVDENKIQLGGFGGLDDPWNLNLKNHAESEDDEK